MWYKIYFSYYGLFSACPQSKMSISIFKYHFMIFTHKLDHPINCLLTIIFFNKKICTTSNNYITFHLKIKLQLNN